MPRAGPRLCKPGAARGLYCAMGGDVRLWAWPLVVVTIACHGGADGVVADASSSSGGDASSSTSTSDGLEPGTQTGETDGQSPPSEPGAAAFGGGTRLAPVVETSPEGEVRLLYWYDRELSIECEFARAGDGTMRCLPRTTDGILAGFDGQACEKAVVSVGTCGAAPSLVSMPAPGAAECDEGPRQLTFRVGAPTLAPAELWRVYPGVGHCMFVEGGKGGGDYRELERVDDEMFVAAQWYDEPDGRGLAERVFAAEDGSWERHGLVNPATGFLCSPYPAASGHGQWHTECSSWLPHLGMAFAASDCSDPLIAVADDGTCRPPEVVPAGGGDWVRLGARIEDSPAYGGSPETCWPRDVDDWDVDDLYRPGASAPAPEPLRVTPEFLGEGRLQRLAWRGEAGGLHEVHRGSQWYDSALEHGCESLATADGLRVCATATAPLEPTEVWGDRACESVELREHYGEYVPNAMVFWQDTGCGRVALEARAVLGRYDGRRYRRDREGACVPALDDGFMSEFVQLGDTVPMFNLPQLTRQTLTD